MFLYRHLVILYIGSHFNDTEFWPTDNISQTHATAQPPIGEINQTCGTLFRVITYKQLYAQDTVYVYNFFREINYVNRSRQRACIIRRTHHIYQNKNTSAYKSIQKWLQIRN